MSYELRLYQLLEKKAALYNCPEFIQYDPVSVPHRFSKKEDIEISGFLTATLSWGQRQTIINKANILMELMDNAPYNFIVNFKDSDLKPVQNFVHRTFNCIDCTYFLRALKNIYTNHGGIESVFTSSFNKFGNGMKDAIEGYRNVFLELPHPKRVEKHLSSPAKNASAKRINMFLRWMVRRDNKGVDFGLWKRLHPKDLIIPLDLHTGNTARSLGLLTSKSNNWKAAVELTTTLKQFDPQDPVKYDFALFGTGIYEKVR